MPESLPDRWHAWELPRPANCWRPKLDLLLIQSELAGRQEAGVNIDVVLPGPRLWVAEPAFVALARGALEAKHDDGWRVLVDWLLEWPELPPRWHRALSRVVADAVAA